MFMKVAGMVQGLDQPLLLNVDTILDRLGETPGSRDGGQVPHSYRLHKRALLVVCSTTITLVRTTEISSVVGDGTCVEDLKKRSGG